MLRVVILLAVVLYASGSPFVPILVHGEPFIIDDVGVDSDNLLEHPFPKECNNGPTFWCQDMRSAKQCGATKHCIQTVWEHIKYPEDDDDVCQVCKVMVAEARDQLRSNETQEEIKEVFEGSCRLMRIKLVVNECIQLSDEFIPELIEYLSSAMNPNIVCTVAGLCNSRRIDQMIEMESKTTKAVSQLNTSDCKLCQQAMLMISKHLKNESLQDLQTTLFHVCENVGSLSDACKATVVQEIHAIYQAIHSPWDPFQLCKFLNICPSNYEHDMPKKQEIKENELITKVDKFKVTEITCDFCKAMVTHLRDILITNTTEDEFYEVLKGICGQTGKYKEECLAIVDQYYKAFYEFLLNDLDPQQICDLIGICSPTIKKVEGPSWILNRVDEISQTKLRPAIVQLKPASNIIGLDEANSYKKPVTGNVIGLDEANSYRKPVTGNVIGLDEANSYKKSVTASVIVPSQTESHVGGRTLCVFCEYALHHIQETLSLPANEEQIKEAVESLCDYFPQTVSDECQTFVKIYGDTFIALLVQDIDPSLICPKLHVCPSQSNELQSVTNNAITCVLCQYVIHTLEDILNENKTQEAIINALDKVCDKFQGEILADCQIFVHDYVEEIVEGISAEFNPEEICVYLHICKVKKTPHELIETNEIPQLENSKSKMPASHNMPITVIKTQAVSNAMDSTTICIMCEFAMNQLDDILEKNATEEEIKIALESLCKYLPPTMYEECDGFINLYADEIIQLLVEECQPKTVCLRLKLCNNGSATVKATIVHLNSSQCDACQVVVDYLDKLLENEDIESAIDAALRKVCRLVPRQYKSECKNIVDTYGSFILGLLGEFADKNLVCQAIELCNQKQGHVKIIGGHKCAWGPAYWCKSSYHAQVCKATQHCREKVWNTVRMP